MRLPSIGLALLAPVLSVACGAAKAEPPRELPDPRVTELSDAAAPPAAPSSPPQAATMPTACSGEPATCTPPPAFVDALCNANFLEASLALFEKGTPWTRGYLRGDVDGWYASGGGSARAKLLFDEEVLVLRARAAATTGVVVGNGGTSYDVLRWDGYCYTVDSGELTMKRPPKAKSPPLPFQHLGEPTQTALLHDAKVLAAHSRRGKECHGVTTGDVSLACVRADQALGDAIVEYVRGGGALPPPGKIPGG